MTITITLENREIVLIDVRERTYIVTDRLGDKGRYLEVGRLVKMPTVVPGKPLVLARVLDPDGLDVDRYGKVESVQYRAEMHEGYVI